MVHWLSGHTGKTVSPQEGDLHKATDHAPDSSSPRGMVYWLSDDADKTASPQGGDLYMATDHTLDSASPVRGGQVSLRGL